jgi:DNA-binding protein YbaB
MSDQVPAGSSRLEAMFQMLADEQRKLAEFQQKMNEAKTVVESSNKMITLTFDGRGELIDLAFNNSKFRSMAPKELAAMVMETLKRGRAAAFGKIDEMTPGEPLPGIKFGDLAAGKVDINDVVGQIMTNAMDLPDLTKSAREGRDNG